MANSPQRIRVITKAFCLVRVFTFEHQELSLAELAKRTGLNPVTAYRILQTLVDENILVQSSETALYRLGYGLAKLGDLAKASNSILKVAYPFLEKLTKEWGETSIVDVLDKNLQIKTILLIPSTFRVGMNPSYDEPVNPHCTSTGKLMLANLPHEQLMAFMKGGLESETDKTIIDAATLLKELETVRSSGYAINNEEQEIGFVAVGAPIYDMRGNIHSAVSLGGPTSRMTEDRLPKIIESVKLCANAISAEMGYRAVEKVDCSNLKRQYPDEK